MINNASDLNEITFRILPDSPVIFPSTAVTFFETSVSPHPEQSNR